MKNPKIIDIRRVFSSETYTEYEHRFTKNPMYNSKEAKEFMMRGNYYPFEEYIEKEIPVRRVIKRSHIEYKIQCSHCGTSAWVRRKDAKYCSGNCRKLAYRERKKARNV